jgi:hypothetical protein
MFNLRSSTDPPTVLNRVDGAAEALSVHVRRIYELIKILEILSLVAVSFHQNLFLIVS